MSVQRGVVAAVSDLRGRRGVSEASFSGEVYFVDMIACNPGAAGGALTNRKGELLGILGPEFKSTLGDTWANYAAPAQAKAQICRKGKTETETLASFTDKAIKGIYEVGDAPPKKKGGQGGYHGITLVPNVVDRTPPYIEEVDPKSPAAAAGLKADD